jgi:hypothetical protein
MHNIKYKYSGNLHAHEADFKFVLKEFVQKVGS